MPRLRRSDCSAPGIERGRIGRGFAYSFDGQRVDDPAVLSRIRSLVLPPAWSDVWICPWPNGHIQALGSDAAGRRQYRHHDDWRTRRDREKFDHMLEFASVLPAVRALLLDRRRRSPAGHRLLPDRSPTTEEAVLDLLDGA